MDGDTSGLAATAAKGVFWTGGGQAIRQVIQVLTAVALARMLVPDDFGLLGMAIVFTGFAQMFADFGVGAAIVQSRHITPGILSSCFWVNLMVGCGITLLLIAAAPWIAEFYGRPELSPVVMALSSTLLLSAISVVPGALLGKWMRFDQIAKGQVFGSLIGSATAVGCAWYGFGVWSLVIQPIVGSLITTVLAFVYCRWRPGPEFSLGAIRSLVAFSANVLGSSVLNYVIRSADSLLIGKFLGSGPLGYYAMAYQLMLYPLGQVSSVIVRVLFPTLSQLQGEMERFRRAYLTAVSAIALVTFPMMVGLFAVSEDFVAVIFGDKWLPMLPVLEILCWVGMLQSIGATVGTIYLAVARTRTMFVLTLGAMPIFVTAFLVGINWGIVGVATAYALVSFMFFYISLAVAFSTCGLTFSDFHRALSRILLSSLVMMAAYVLVLII